MKEPFWNKVRQFVAQPLPRRRRTEVATWIEWRCRCYHVRNVEVEQ